MAQYQKFKTKVFDLKKDARSWCEKIKKQNQGSGQTMKIETNYLTNEAKWEAIVLVKM